VAAQAGCVTVIVVIVALVAGVWLDRVLGTRQMIGIPVATIGLIILSVPVSVVLMIRTVLSGMARFHAARGNRPVDQAPRPLGGMWRKGPGGRQDDDDE
jgi:hypothetical protein